MRFDSDKYLTALEAIQDAIEDDRIVIGEVITPVEAHLHPNALGRSGEVSQVETDNVRPEFVLGKQQFVTQDGENIFGCEQ